jgi:hypothetical protein
VIVIADDTAATGAKRKQHTWPKQARELVRAHLAGLRSSEMDASMPEPKFRLLVNDLVKLTSYPREVCSRFSRRLGVCQKRGYKEWSRAEQQRLLDLIALNPPHEVAKLMRRSVTSVRGMLQRLGASAQMGRDWFTVYTLAEALHLRVQEVQRWMDQGWLPSRVVATGGLSKRIIHADDFAAFCKTHATKVIGRRLHRERLEFVRTFVFPSSHTELLPVRERGYRKRSSDLPAGDVPNTPAA